jgi:hypothetical protein
MCGFYTYGMFSLYLFASPYSLLKPISVGIFLIFLILGLWAYFKAALTSPGYVPESM